MNNKIDIWNPEVSLFDIPVYRINISDSPEKEKLEHGFVSYKAYKELLDIYDVARNGGSGI